MQPLLITSLVALLIALIKLKTKTDELADSEFWHKHWTAYSVSLATDLKKMRVKCDEQILTINKFQIDNALLKAEPRKKHRRVPKL